MTQRKCTNTELLLVDMETVSRPTAASLSVYQNQNEILTSHSDHRDKSNRMIFYATKTSENEVERDTVTASML